jgi:hypothetical protein
MEMLVPVRMRATHPGYRTTFFAAPSARPMGAGRDAHQPVGGEMTIARSHGTTCRSTFPHGDEVNR